MIGMTVGRAGRHRRPLALTCASRGGGRLFAAFAFLCVAHFLPAAAFAADASADPWAEVMTPLPGPAEIFGGPTHGCIVGARPLPPDGPGYEVVRLSRRRYFGHPDLVAFIKRLGRRARAAGLPPFYVGDMAQPRGGPMPAGHAAHQIGMEADIFFALDRHPYLAPSARDEVPLPSMLLSNYHQLDTHAFGPRQIELLKLAATDAAVARIFVNPLIKAAVCRAVIGSAPAERVWIRKIRPWFGHAAHFHVRLHCPASSPDCQEQKSPPLGDGCGAELASWLRHLPPPPPEDRVHPLPSLPVACHRVLMAK
jgi:penicillin-insensitive murein DD-endopeptidase